VSECADFLCQLRVAVALFVGATRAWDRVRQLAQHVVTRPHTAPLINHRTRSQPHKRASGAQPATGCGISRRCVSSKTGAASCVHCGCLCAYLSACSSPNGVCAHGGAPRCASVSDLLPPAPGWVTVCLENDVDCAWTVPRRRRTLPLLACNGGVKRQLGGRSPQQA